MRHYDIPYVPNGPVNYYPSVPLQDMSLEEIKKKYIKTCAKANGNLSECSKCKSPCPEGKRAIQLVANQIYNDPPVPLYGGKTLIEKAKEENMKRREELAKKENQTETITKRGKDGRKFIDDWYDKAMATDDPLKWVMDTYQISKTKAKNKIRMWEIRHPKNNTEEPEQIKETPVIEEPKIEVKTEAIALVPKENNIEAKLEELMRQQEEHKKAMKEYQRLYDEAKAEYEKIKQKTDILCNALDILND